MFKRFKSMIGKISNLSIDITVWIGGISVGFLPTIIMDLLYPEDVIINMAPIDRILSDVETVYAFLSGLVVLIIEQMYVDDLNKKAKSTLTKGKIMFLFIDIIFMLLYISLKPFSIEEIESLLCGNIITLNKTIIMMSLFMAVSLIITHSLSEPTNRKE